MSSSIQSSVSEDLSALSVDELKTRLSKLATSLPEDVDAAVKASASPAVREAQDRLESARREVKAVKRKAKAMELDRQSLLDGLDEQNHALNDLHIEMEAANESIRAYLGVLSGATVHEDS